MGRRAPTITITFVKGDGQRYRSIVRRRDGVVVELDGGGYNQVGGPARRIPHDLAHAVVEDALGLDSGLWGVIVAGGMFAHTTVVAGRRPPHADRRAQAVVDGAGDRLAQAEVVVRAVADLSLAGRDRDTAGLVAATGPRWRPDGLTAEALGVACRRLRADGERWAALGPQGTLELDWRLPEPRR
ncbi:hypothetical protein [Patulibacter minatonensis]|uniref:hypothetical protein n=1 Tax=Patulibacter minatonensis TaxID=298163 RepID=UPI0004B5E5E6|nr:hypothetical protein [Patulibacter minatonensis]